MIIKRSETRSGRVLQSLEGTSRSQSSWLTTSLPEQAEIEIECVQVPATPPTWPEEEDYAQTFMSHLEDPSKFYLHLESSTQANLKIGKQKI